MKGRRWKKIYRENTRSREFPSYLLFVVDFFFTAVFSIFVVIAHIYLCITVLFLFPSRLFFSHFKSISIILSGAHNQSLCIKFIPFVGCILLKLLVCLECVSSFPDVCVFFRLFSFCTIIVIILSFYLVCNFSDCILWISSWDVILF